ncbi:hypothetical protein GTY49_33870 [Streptomyces sp. SID5477]|nr:hypothetical protein [Streptomyces sp. SID5477]
MIGQHKLSIRMGEARWKASGSMGRVGGISVIVILCLLILGSNDPRWQSRARPIGNATMRKAIETGGRGVRSHIVGRTEHGLECLSEDFAELIRDPSLDLDRCRPAQLRFSLAI